MDLGLERKVALVTGASRGIGLGIARALGAEGAVVAVSSSSKERIEAAAAEVGGRPYVYDSDDLGGAPALVERVEADLGPLAVLVTNTGGPPRSEDSLAPRQDEWEAAYRRLILSPMALIRAAVPGMRDRCFGRIVSVSSSAVREPIPGLVLSTAHRSGLLAAFKQLAREVAADGVTLNSVLPGRIATSRLAETYGSIEAAEGAAAGEVPAGRLGNVDEIAAVATFLCSAPASYLTGAAVLVDGGLTRGI